MANTRSIQEHNNIIRNKNNTSNNNILNLQKNKRSKERRNNKQPTQPIQEERRMTLEYEIEKDYETPNTITYLLNRKGLNIGILIIDKKYAKIGKNNIIRIEEKRK